MPTGMGINCIKKSSFLNDAAEFFQSWVLLAGQYFIVLFFGPITCLVSIVYETLGLAFRH